MRILDSETIQVNLLTSFFGQRASMTKIDWIVVHYAGIACTNGDASFVSKVFHKAEQRFTKGEAVRKSSTHFVVGEHEIFQLVDLKQKAWHVGSQSATNKCEACNNNSIGVDLCESKINTQKCSASDRDWYFTNQVLENGAQLVAELADRYNIRDSHIVRHFDVTGKKCPRPFVGKDVNEFTHKTGDEAWKEFKEAVKVRRTKLFCS